MTGPLPPINQRQPIQSHRRSHSYVPVIKNTKMVSGMAKIEKISQSIGILRSGSKTKDVVKKNNVANRRKVDWGLRSFFRNRILLKNNRTIKKEGMVKINRLMISARCFKEKRV